MTTTTPTVSSTVTSTSTVTQTTIITTSTTMTQTSTSIVVVTSTAPATPACTGGLTCFSPYNIDIYCGAGFAGVGGGTMFVESGIANYKDCATISVQRGCNVFNFYSLTGECDLWYYATSITSTFNDPYVVGGLYRSFGCS